MRGDVGGTDSWTGKSRRAYKSMRVRRSRRVAPAPSGASEAIGSYLNEYACPITAETMTDLVSSPAARWTVSPTSAQPSQSGSALAPHQRHLAIHGCKTGEQKARPEPDAFRCLFRHFYYFTLASTGAKFAARSQFGALLVWWCCFHL